MTKAELMIERYNQSRDAETLASERKAQEAAYEAKKALKSSTK